MHDWKAPRMLALPMFHCPYAHLGLVAGLRRSQPVGRNAKKARSATIPVILKGSAMMPVILKGR